MHEGYIKLYRSLLDEPYANKPDYLSVWLHLLLLANHKDTSFVLNNKTEILKAGQLITGRKKLSRITGVKETKVYKILNYLEKEQQIKQQKNNRFTIITILNWQKYQGKRTTKEQEKEQQKNNKETTKEQQRDNKETHTINVKNVKNVKNIYKEKEYKEKEKIKYADYVSMTEEEYQKLIEKYGKDNTLAFIEKLNVFKGANGKKYKSDYLAILNWVVDAVLNKGGANVSNVSRSNPRFKNERQYDEDELNKRFFESKL